MTGYSSYIALLTKLSHAQGRAGRAAISRDRTLQEALENARAELAAAKSRMERLRQEVQRQLDQARAVLGPGGLPAVTASQVDSATGDNVTQAVRALQLAVQRLHADPAQEQPRRSRVPWKTILVALAAATAIVLALTYF